jgi:phosphatidate cytidylyltransferase
MAEGEGKKPEDLFEDLDKFFAPVQGDDWPIPAEGAEAPAEETSEPTWANEPPEDEAPTDEAPEDVAAEAEPVGEPAPAGDDDFFAGSAEQDQVAEPEGAEPSEHADQDPFFTGDRSSGEAIDEVGAEGAADSTFAPEPEAEPEGIEIIEIEDEEGESLAPPIEEEIQVAPLETSEEVESAAALFGPSADVEESILAGLDDEDAQIPVAVGSAEGLQGPSWQEPTSEAIGAEVAPPSSGRDLPAAVLTGVVLAALALGALAIGDAAFAIVGGLVVLAAQGEFYAAVTRRHFQPATALGLASGVLILGGAYFHGEPAAAAMLALGVLCTFIWYMVTPPPHRHNVVVNAALTILGMVWIPFLGSSLLVILTVPGVKDVIASGAALVVMVLVLVFVYDTAAFGFGSLWGDHPLAPNVSPRKSREGAIAASFAVFIVSLLFAAPLDGVGFAGALWLAIAVIILAPLGDLVESLVKRDLGIKDMGSVLPGHGGVLDRIDSLLFVAPAALIILRMVLLG